MSGITKADEINQIAGHKSGCPIDNTIALNRPARCREKKKGPGCRSIQKDSPAIVGMVNHQGEVVVEVLPDVKKETLKPAFEKSVEKGGTIYTDSASCYSCLEKANNKHDTVNHSQGEDVRGYVHEKRAENLWLFWLFFILPFLGVAQQNLSDNVKVFQSQRNHSNLAAFGRVMYVLNSFLHDLLHDDMGNWISEFKDSFISTRSPPQMSYSGS